MTPRKRLPDPSSKHDTKPASTVRFGLNFLEPDIRRVCEELSAGDAMRVEVLGPREAVVR